MYLLNIISFEKAQWHKSYSHKLIVPMQGKLMAIFSKLIETENLTLEPMSLSLGYELFIATRSEPAIFRYLPIEVEKVGALEAWIGNAIGSTLSGKATHLVIRQKKTSVVVGHTAIIGIRPDHKGCEIGWTWILNAFRGRGYGVESKRSMYDFLFAECDMQRVQLIADTRNERSISSIQKSGATKEGVLRLHQRTPSGNWRDTVVFSVTKDDWTKGIK